MRRIRISLQATVSTTSQTHTTRTGARQARGGRLRTTRRARYFRSSSGAAAAPAVSGGEGPFVTISLWRTSAPAQQRCSRVRTILPFPENSLGLRARCFLLFATDRVILLALPLVCAARWRVCTSHAFATCLCNCRCLEEASLASRRRMVRWNEGSPHQQQSQLLNGRPAQRISASALGGRRAPSYVHLSSDGSVSVEASAASSHDEEEEEDFESTAAIAASDSLPPYDSRILSGTIPAWTGGAACGGERGPSSTAATCSPAADTAGPPLLAARAAAGAAAQQMLQPAASDAGPSASTSAARADSDSGLQQQQAKGRAQATAAVAAPLNPARVHMELSSRRLSRASHRRGGSAASAHVTSSSPLASRPPISPERGGSAAEDAASSSGGGSQASATHSGCLPSLRLPAKRRKSLSLDDLQQARQFFQAFHDLIRTYLLPALGHLVLGVVHRSGQFRLPTLSAPQAAVGEWRARLRMEEERSLQEEQERQRLRQAQVRPARSAAIHSRSLPFRHRGLSCLIKSGTRR